MFLTGAAKLSCFLLVTILLSFLLTFRFDLASGAIFLKRIIVRCFKCDAMMHVLKDSINLKYSELLTEVIRRCNLI